MKLLLAKIIGFFINLIAYISPNYAARLAIKLFSTPRKGRLTDEATDFLGTAFQEEVECEGMPVMTYRWLGKGQTILLVHGWESNSFRWKNLILSLKSEGYNIISIDAPGHGKSGGKTFNAVDYSECIHKVIRKFTVDTVIAHSVGGMATILCQKKYNLPYLKRIVLLGSPSNFKDIFKRYTDMMSYNKSLIKSINNFVLENFGHLPEYYNTAKFSNDIDVKGLIIHDKYDDIIPYDDAKDYESNFLNSSLITTTNLKHGLKSDEVDNYILEFISK